jgi:hypothetical protein
MNHHKQETCSKRPVQQSRRGFGARSVHGVCEGERREERQACEREADKGPRTTLADFFNRLINHFPPLSPALGSEVELIGGRTAENSTPPFSLFEGNHSQREDSLSLHRMGKIGC